MGSATNVVPLLLCDLRYEQLHRGAQGTHQTKRLTFFQKKKKARKTKQSIYLIIAWYSFPENSQRIKAV